MAHEKSQKPKVSKIDQKLLALWAADCAEHVLEFFEKEFPHDKRPREAIDAAREWAEDKIPFGEVRSKALHAHVAARSVAHHLGARAAARSAGHAAATAHVAGHAPHAALYAQAAAKALHIDGEREWQYKKMPKHLRTLPLFDEELG